MDEQNKDQQSINGVESISQQVSGYGLTGAVVDTPIATVSQFKRNKRKKWPLIVACLLIVLIAAGILYLVNANKKTVVPAASQNKVIRIGLMTPLSGDSVQIGASAKLSVELALKEFNKEGVTVQLVTRDTDCAAAKSEPAVKDLIDNEKVVAIIGDYCSGATLAAIPYADQHHVVMISPMSSSPKITDAGDYIFRTIPSDALQGKFVADLIHKKDLTKLAILYGNEPYGIGLSDSVRTSFAALGGKVVAFESFENESIHLEAQMNRIKTAAPDSFYVISNSPPSSVAAILGAKSAGITAQLFGSESIKSQTIVNDAAAAAEGLTVSSVPGGTAAYVQKYQAAYQLEPGDFSAQAYDAAKILTKAFAQGAYTGETIKDVVARTDMVGVSGHIKFDKNGDIPGNYEVFIVKNGKFVKINP